MTFADFPPRRAVVLGASNVTRSIATVVEAACRAWGRPLDVLAAAGLGRSYGMRSSVLGRSLPGIVECGLWQALATRPAAPTAALITDIGNDLFYGATPEKIAGWVEECCRRLTAAEAILAMTRLPVCNAGRLAAWQFAIFRTLSYPGCRTSLSEMTRQACELDERVAEVARRYECRLIEPQRCWYGVDPVHITPFQAGGAWQTIFAGWQQPISQPAAKLSLRRWVYLNIRVPEQRWLFGCRQERRQPCAQMSDGTLVSLF